MPLADLLGGVGAVAGLFGAGPQKTARKSAHGSIVGTASGIREAAEKYNINPLALLGVPQASGGGTSFGARLGDAALMLADRLRANGPEVENAKLQQANAKLQSKVQQLTLRPKIPGIYDRPAPIPSIRQSMGVPDDNRPLANPRSTDAPGPLTAAGSADPLGPAPLSSSDGSSKPPKVPLRLFGSDLYPNANSADAEAVETRYGELAAEFFGGANLVYDIGRNAFPKRQRISEARRKAAERMKLKPPRSTRRFDPNHRDGYFDAF